MSQGYRTLQYVPLIAANDVSPIHWIDCELRVVPFGLHVLLLLCFGKKGEWYYICFIPYGVFLIIIIFMYISIIGKVAKENIVLTQYIYICKVQIQIWWLVIERLSWICIFAIL